MAEHPQPVLAVTELSAPRGGRGARRGLLVVGPSLGTRVVDLWADVADVVARGCPGVEVIGWDLPGHGASPAATEDFTLEGLAAAVLTLATHRAKSRPFWLAGVSLGGMVSLAAAVDTTLPRAVLGLACDAVIGTPEAWQQRADQACSAGLGPIATASGARWFAPGFVDEHPQRAGSLLAGFDDVDAESYARCCQALAAADLRPVLSQVLPPTVLAPGSHDQVIDLSSTTTSAAALADGQRVVIADCGHQPPVEQPATVSALLTRIISSGQTATTRPSPSSPQKAPR